MAPRSLARWKPENSDQRVGIDIVRRALAASARLIAENAGADSSIVVGKLREKTDGNHGFDAQSGNYTDMVKADIIDPTKVVRLACRGRPPWRLCCSPPRPWSAASASRSAVCMISAR
jgi:chaperonin GroEL